MGNCISICCKRKRHESSIRNHERNEDTEVDYGFNRGFPRDVRREFHQSLVKKQNSLIGHPPSIVVNVRSSTVNYDHRKFVKDNWDVRHFYQDNRDNRHFVQDNRDNRHFVQDNRDNRHFVQDNRDNRHFVQDNRKFVQDNRDNRQTVFNQPKAEAMQFGNGGEIRFQNSQADSNHQESQKDHYNPPVFEKPFIEKRLSDLETQYRQIKILQKVHQQEILRRLKRSFPKSSVGVSSKDHRYEKSHYKDNDKLLMKRSRSNRKSKKTYDLKTDGTHGVLQNLKWDQYKKSEQVKRYARSLFQTCQTVQEVKRVAKQVKKDIQEEFSNYTKELVQQFEMSTSSRRLSSSNNNTTFVENAKVCLKENEERVVNSTERKINVLRNDSFKRIEKCSDNITNIEWGSEINTGEEAAERFITKLTKLIITNVESELTFMTEQEIVVYTFKCQKSYVLRRIMTDFITGQFEDSMKFVFEPNTFANKWLKKFTNKKMFYQKKHGLHTYAKRSKYYTDMALREINDAFLKANESEHFNTWVDTFLKLLHASNSLPISKNDIATVFESGTSPCKRKFTAIVSHRLATLDTDILNYFKNIDESNVCWDSDVYSNIFKKLWGCTVCCPFCNEPCRFTDDDHIKEGLSHACLQHRPLGITGFLTDIELTLVIDNCNNIVREDDKWYMFHEDEDKRMCKDYKNEFREWNIELNPVEIPVYWAWFMIRFCNCFSELYGASSPKFSDDWKKITPEEAVKSLEVVYSWC